MNTVKTSLPGMPAMVIHRPLVDRLQERAWRYQVASIRLVRSLRFARLVVLPLLVLWVCVGWRPWRYANQAIRDTAIANPDLDPYWTNFRFDPYMTTAAAVFLAFVFACLSFLTPGKKSDSEDRPTLSVATFLIALRYMAMQLISDPVGTAGLIVIVWLSGFNPFFWMWDKPWYWRPHEWDLEFIFTRTILTFSFLLLMYVVSRRMLARTARRYTKLNEESPNDGQKPPHRKPPWLVLWRSVVMVACHWPDTYSVIDRSTTKTADILAKQEEAPPAGTRKIGAAPRISWFGTTKRYPTVSLRTDVPLSKDWPAYEEIIDRLKNTLKHALGPLAPWRLDLVHETGQSDFGWLIIRFAPPGALTGPMPLPDTLFGPPDVGSLAHLLPPLPGNPGSRQAPDPAVDEVEEDDTESFDWIKRQQEQFLAGHENPGKEES